MLATGEDASYAGCDRHVTGGECRLAELNEFMEFVEDTK